MNQIPPPQKQSASSTNFFTDASAWLENLFGAIGSFIRSLSFSLTGLIIFLAYRFIEVENIFFEYFPKHLSTMNKELAANLIAVVFVIPTLLFMSNSDKLKSPFAFLKTGWLSRVNVPTAMAWVTFVINLFFWRVWVGTADTIIFKVVISIITAYFDYTFSELFNKKFQDWLRTSKLNESFYKMEQRANEAKQTLKGLIERANKSQQILKDQKELLREIEQDISLRKKGLERYACPYCLTYVGDHQNGVNKHLGSCPARKKELTDKAA
jgi:hypothetical protein